MNTLENNIKLAQARMNHSAVICKDMIDRATNQYVVNTKELTDAMSRWYNASTTSNENA